MLTILLNPVTYPSGVDRNTRFSRTERQFWLWFRCLRSFTPLRYRNRIPRLGTVSRITGFVTFNC